MKQAKSYLRQNGDADILLSEEQLIAALIKIEASAAVINRLVPEHGAKPGASAGEDQRSAVLLGTELWKEE